MNFEGYKYIAILMVLVEIAILFLVYRRNPKLTIYLTLLSIVLKGQYLWVGSPIYAWQFSALLGLSLLARMPAGTSLGLIGNKLSHFRSIMILYFAYTLTISMAMWVIFSTGVFGLDMTGVPITRMITQTAYFLLIVGLYCIGVWTSNHITTFNLLRALIYIAVVVAYFGILQAIVMTISGVNIFPIIGIDDTVRSAYILDKTFRVTSFAGEPKHLGLLMSLGLSLLFLARLFRIQVGGRFALHMPLAMGTALILSLSTTGIVITATSLIVSGLLFFSRIRKIDLLITGVLAAIVFSQSNHFSEDFIFSLGQQLSKTQAEVQDESIRQALVANPILFSVGSGLGNIHLLAADFLPPEFPLFRDHGYKANSGLYFVLGDSGLIGLILLLLSPIFALRTYLLVSRGLSDEQRKEAITVLALIFIATLSFIMRYDVIYFLFSGFVTSRLSILRQGVALTVRVGHRAMLNETRENIISMEK